MGKKLIQRFPTFLQPTARCNIPSSQLLVIPVILLHLLLLLLLRPIHSFIPPYRCAASCVLPGSVAVVVVVAVLAPPPCSFSHLFPASRNPHISIPRTTSITFPQSRQLPHHTHSPLQFISALVVVSRRSFGRSVVRPSDSGSRPRPPSAASAMPLRHRRVTRLFGPRIELVRPSFPPVSSRPVSGRVLLPRSMYRNGTTRKY